MVITGRGETGSHKRYGNEIEFFDCTTERWVLGGARFAARAGHTMSVLRDGRILVVGGRKEEPVEFFKVAKY